MNISPEQRSVIELFMPEDLRRRDRLIALGTRFVHYTTAEAAVSILTNKEVWMRNATTMNDFSEVQYGTVCLLAAYNSEYGNRLRKVLDQVEDKLSESFAILFSSWLPTFEKRTYITSISEHDEKEDLYGRLSMWRAYGGQNGIAFILKNGPFVAQTDRLEAYSAAIIYKDQVAFTEEFAALVLRLESATEQLKALGSGPLISMLFHTLRSAILCTKHPGFLEEREWRIIYSPELAKSAAINEELKTIRGVSQLIQKIPFIDQPNVGLFGADIPSFIDRIIIGPTQYPSVMCEAFVHLLQQAGVQNPTERVCISSIPLRNM